MTLACIIIYVVGLVLALAIFIVLSVADYRRKKALKEYQEKMKSAKR